MTAHVRALAVAFVLTAVVLAPLASAKFAGPAITKGDTWRWQVTNTQVNGGDSGNRTLTVKAPEDITVKGKTYAGAWREDASETTMKTVSAPVGPGVPVSTSTTTTRESAETSYFDPDSGGLVRRQVVDTTTTSTSGVNNGQTSTSNSKWEYDQPCLDLQFPLHVGDKWVRRCIGTFTTSGQATGAVHIDENISYEVTSSQSSTVKAGTFESFTVKRTYADGAVDTWTYAQSVCAPAKVVSANAQGALLFTRELVTGACASKGAAAQDATPTPSTESSTPPSSSTQASTPPSSSTAASTPSTSTEASSTPASSTTASTKTPGLEAIVVIGAVAALALAGRKRA